MVFTIEWRYGSVDCALRCSVLATLRGCRTKRLQPSCMHVAVADEELTIGITVQGASR